MLGNMKINKLQEIIKLIKPRSLEGKIEQEVVKPIISNEDITDEEIANRIVALLKEHPEQRKEIIEQLEEKDEVSDDILAQSAVRIVNDPNLV